MLLLAGFGRTYFSTLKMEAMCSSETSVETNGLHGIIFQMLLSLKTVFFQAGEA
jgi:exopolysaccharide biosynthesis predicted pyruvyltransferase EpsI